MFWHRLLNLHLLAIRQLDLQERIWQTNLLYSTLNHYGMGIHVKKFVLNTTTTAV
jgi:hypothetical protein